MNDVTRILDAVAHGEAGAAEKLLPLVYTELRQLAARKMAQEHPGQTLQPTALVHEAWLRLAGDEHRKWNDRTHFFAAAAEAMRRILVDNARRKRARRHGGGQQRVELNEVNVAAPGSDDELLALDEALEKLAAQNCGEAEVVKLRYFVGMTIEETADALDISVRTANYHWSHARAWLYKEIREQQGQ
jgi:RNA polymerase sigma factor (TIGR02999 family)